MSIENFLAHSWNIFKNREPTKIKDYYSRYSDSVKPDRVRLSRGQEKSVINSIYNRIAVDCSSVKIEHCKVDDNDRYISSVNSGLNNCLNLEANIDQNKTQFMIDIIISLLDEGCVAVVPIDTDVDIENNSFSIETLRVCKITGWHPKTIDVEVFNEDLGFYQNMPVPKSATAIIENPFYSIMNEENSTAKRLSRKLSLLDVTDDKTCSGKLDMIIQLPYMVKSEARRNEALRRRDDIMEQLQGPLGVAYIDGTEKVTQLNRPLENNLLKQIEYLTSQLMTQLSITPEILNGTANAETMMNYMSRTISPILDTIVLEFKRKFLTKTARTQGQTIKYFIDPFKVIPVNNLAELSDKFTRNEILTSNEFRQILGFKPSDDPKADMLVNTNIPQNTPEIGGSYAEGQESQNEYEYIDTERDQLVYDTLDQFANQIDQMFLEVTGKHMEEGESYDTNNEQE